MQTGGGGVLPGVTPVFVLGADGWEMLVMAVTLSGLVAADHTAFDDTTFGGWHAHTHHVIV
jgi:hypothetical protein